MGLLDLDRYEFEKNVAAGRGWATFCGTDEAGRGPLAGPVYAAAVNLRGVKIEGLNDSKKLSEKRRERLFDEICEKVAYAICFSTVEQIDSTDILTASLDAMHRAVLELQKIMDFNGVIVDGNTVRGFPVPATPVVKGDEKCASVAAASILAKVARDREMVKLDTDFPGYGFAKHKGYPTVMHYEALRKLGASPVHRKSFLKSFYVGKHGTTTKAVGDNGENIAAQHLMKCGWMLLECNFRTRYGEIDLILRNAEFVIFTEVKLRKSSAFANAAEFVDAKKQAKIRTVALEWLSQNPTNLQARFDVIEVYPAVSSRDRNIINHIENAF